MPSQEEFARLVCQLGGLTQAKVRETSHRLEITVPIWALNLRPLVEDALSWGASLEVVLIHSGLTCLFHPEDQDIELQRFAVAPEHEEQIEELLEDQKRTQYRHWQRWNFVAKVTGPTHPEQAYVELSFVKADLTKRLIPGLDSKTAAFLWFFALNEPWEDHLPDWFHETEKPPALIIVPKAQTYWGNMIVVLSWENLTEGLIVNAVKHLISACDTLAKLRTERLRGVAQNSATYYPPDYWVPTSGAGMMNAWILCQLVFSVFFSAADKVSKKGGSWTFSIDRQHVVDANVVVTSSEVSVNGVKYGPSSLEATRELAQECIAGKPFEGNRRLLQNAVFFAGNFDLSALVTKAQELVRYYNFEYRGLLENNIKEQSDTVRAFLIANQDLRNKLQGTVEQFYSAFAVVVTGLAGIFFGLVATGFKDNDRLYSIAFYACFVYAFLYVPVWIVRLYQLRGLAIAWVTRYKADLDLVERLYKYPLQKLAGIAEDPVADIRQQIQTHFKVTLLWSLVSALAAIVADLVFLSQSEIDFIGALPLAVRYGAYIICMGLLWLVVLMKPVRLALQRHDSPQ